MNTKSTYLKCLNKKSYEKDILYANDVRYDGMYGIM